jgi:hypothetical protein
MNHTFKITADMQEALDFIRKVNGWHGFDPRNKRARDAILKLAMNGQIELSAQTHQFRIKK